MSPFTFRPAVREAAPVIIGVAGASGSGKTMSALRLARGLAGGKPFAGIDTEARRMLHYADQFPELHHGELGPPFTPDRYLEAIQAADDAGFPVIVVDSASHEHAGEGGLLDWHEAEVDRLSRGDDGRREAMNMAGWIKPKMAHKRMVNHLLQLRAHLILCFRAEEKVEIQKNDKGRWEVIAKPSLTGLDGWVPVAEKTLPYELTMSFLLLPSDPGVPKPIKLQEQHRPFVDLTARLDEKAGEQIAAWSAGGSAPKETTGDRETTTIGRTERTQLFEAARAGPLGEDGLRAIVQEITGSTSTGEMTLAQFDRAMKMIQDAK